MSETYIKAEIVRPKRPMPEHVGKFLGGLLILAFRVLIVWWFLAAWFPELGITYWQAILPVYAARMLFGNMTIFGRQLNNP